MMESPAICCFIECVMRRLTFVYCRVVARRYKDSLTSEAVDLLSAMLAPPSTRATVEQVTHRFIDWRILF